VADVVKVKTGSWSTAHWSNEFIRLNGWLLQGATGCSTLLVLHGASGFYTLLLLQSATGCYRLCSITPLDIDGIGQIWENSIMWADRAKIDAIEKCAVSSRPG